MKDLKALRLGRDGERVVGQFLESLMEKGISVTETKTYSKPEKGEAKIYFDGEKISITGAGVYTKPIIQATSASKWLKGVLS